MKIEPTAKRVRAYLGGELIVDSTAVRLVWEDRPYPAYYFPRDDVRTELLTDAAWNSPHADVAELRDLVRIRWSAMDHWFEEDEEVFVHPRSPYVRVDILASSRHVRVVINGVEVANSPRPRILLETGLLPRYYMPLTDVRMELLRPSERTTQCPYKGTANYWSVVIDGQIVEDVLWTYKSPLPESQKIAGLVCFYNERVDLIVD